MPGDLLRFVGGPNPYAGYWLWLAVTLVVLVILWYAAVLLWTMPATRLRELPVLGGLHGRLVRRRFAAAVRDIDRRRRRGELPQGQAYAELNRTVRSFLHLATGMRVQYLQVDELAAGELASAAPLFAALRDARFDGTSDADPAELAGAAEELIRSWT